MCVVVVLLLLLCCCCCVVVVVGLDSAGPPSAGQPKISPFFFPFPPPLRSFCVSLGVFSWNFGGVLKRHSPLISTFGVLGLHHSVPCHTTARELQTRTFEGPSLHKNHQNSTRRPPERHKKSETVETHNNNNTIKKGQKRIPSNPPQLSVSAVVWRENPLHGCSFRTSFFSLLTPSLTALALLFVLFPVNCLRCALVQLGCHMHLLCLRPFFWFGLPNRGPREPYVETTTAWGHSGHNLPVLLVAASNPPNSPSSYLTGSVLSTKDPAAPTVLAICPLFHSHTSQRHALAHDLLQPCIETLFQGGLSSPQPDQP